MYIFRTIKALSGECTSVRSVGSLMFLDNINNYGLGEAFIRKKIIR